MPRPKGHRKPPPAAKPPLTHFLCLPLVTTTSKPQLEASITSFRNAVCPDQPHATQTDDNAIRLHPKAVRPVGALHCTLGVMSLDDERLNKAIELLQSLDIGQLLLSAIGPESTPLGPIIDPQEAPNRCQPSSDDGDAGQPPAHTSTSSMLQRPISPPVTRGSSQVTSRGSVKIDLRGLVSMHAPEKTSIVYIEPHDPSGRLYPLCVALQDVFRRSDLLVPDDRRLKLHATIVNTIYTKGRRSQGHGPQANAPLKIDARALLEKYRDSVWAEDVVLDRIAICEMGAKKRIENGVAVSEEYTEVASVPLLVE